MPQVAETEIYKLSPVEDKYGPFIKNIEIFLNTHFEKFFRKLKILALKFENRFSSWAEKFSEKRKLQSLSQKISFLNSPFFIRYKIRDFEKNLNILDNADLLAEEKKLISNISDNPKDYLLYLKLGIVYFRLKNFEDAKASLEEALKINPNCIEAKMWLGKVDKVLND